MTKKTQLNVIKRHPIIEKKSGTLLSMNRSIASITMICKYPRILTLEAVPNLSDLAIAAASMTERNP